MIELDKVEKVYGSKTALRPITITFQNGKTSALIGPSGCGKSTLLRIIMGLILPSAGQVRIDGEAPSNWLSARRRMGYVVQDGGLFPHLTAEQNVAIMTRHVGWKEDKIRERIAGLCELTRFPTDALSRYPAELSGGQKQRVSVMRALALEPEFLLMDEPLAALDPMVRSALQGDLKDIFQRLGQTVIFVTHDMAEAGFLADVIVLMNEGQVAQIGSLDDLRDRPANDFVKEFISAQRSLVRL